MRRDREICTLTEYEIPDLSKNPIKKAKSKKVFVIFRLRMYRYDQNNKVTERFYSKIATFQRTFSRSLNEARKARPTPKDAQFCQDHFLYRSFFGLLDL